ncbi:MAG: sulfatase [Verrucomicrobiales bacterium]|nr:sulfatase [Verrucomicrobiales bacterium]
MFRIIVYWVSLLVVGVCGAVERPNVVVFFVDDLGWADLGCYGSRLHETPHIDALAKSGLRFTDAYAAASICSPTRASLMTGKHPVRVGITDWIPGSGDKGKVLDTPEDAFELALEEVTVAEAMGEAGYGTFYAGKWHLGGRAFGPDRQGFEVTFDPHNDPSKGSPKRLKRGVEGRPHDTVGITREAVGFLEKNVGERPVFMVLSYYDVHTPIVAEAKHLARYEAKVAALGEGGEAIVERDGLSRGRQDNAAFASMVSAVDDSVGEVLAKLEVLGISDETVVIFTSDNGGLSTKKTVGPTSNLPLRAGKGWLYEGGIRVPLIVRVPGLTGVGKASGVPVVTMDLYPTVLGVAGLEKRPEQHVDGVDVFGKSEREAIFWHYPHYHGSMWRPGGAVRSGKWKLVEFFETGSVELYDLEADPGERFDLVNREKQVAEEMWLKLKDWQEGIGARMPSRR